MGIRELKLTVDGWNVRKSASTAGVVGEGNATALIISFDESWDALAKKITFWDALGQNPVERTLTADLLEDLTADLRTYRVPLPSEPLAYEGDCTIAMDGYADGVRARSVAVLLSVRYAPVANSAGEPSDPNPSQAEQLQVQIDTLLGDISAQSVIAQGAASVAIGKAEVAAQSAQTSITAADRAGSAAIAVQEALDNLPEGAVPIINDLTTGGTFVALSAEQGKMLKVMVDSAIPTAEKGAPNGVAPLDGDGKLPAGNLLLSNDNLLDNAWFEAPYLVNQRGQSSYTGNSVKQLCADRWSVADATITLVSGGVKIQHINGSYGDFVQDIEPIYSSMAGQYATISAEIDGVIYSVTGQMPYISAAVTTGVEFIAWGSDLSSDYSVRIRLTGNKTVTIRRMKFEFSAASTMHLDSPPSPAEQELNRQACRRYYRLWTSEAGRANALKEVNLMRLYTPTLGSISVGGSTYYYASADL